MVSPQSGGGGTDLVADRAGPSAQEPGSQAPLKAMLVISGGEGYIDFRMGECVSPSSMRSHSEQDSSVPFTWESVCVRACAFLCTQSVFV